MTTTMGDWNGTGSTWTTTIASITQATCTVPTTTGYDTGGAGGTVTITGFNPNGVTCATGYTGTVTYTVCGSAGQAYSVSGCQASTTSTTTGSTTGAPLITSSTTRQVATN